MNPQTARDKIADLVAGRLDEATAEKVRAYLLTDDAAREFHEEVVQLYDLDLSVDLEAPRELPAYDTSSSPGTGASGWRGLEPWQRWCALAAALLLVVGGAIFAPDVLRQGDGPSDGTGDLASNHDGDGNDDPSASGVAGVVDFEPLPLMPVSIELPELPHAYHEGEWLESREEAVLTSRYTGRPLLESYINPGCPVSQDVDRELCAKERRADLGNFVCYREAYEGEVPEPVCGQVDSKEIVMMLPAVRISTGDCEPETHWGIRDWDDVQDKVRTYAERCEEAGKDENRGLGRAAFEHNLATLRRVVTLLDEGRCAESLTALEGIMGCKRSCKTAFGETARQLHEQIINAFEEQIAEIARMSGGTAVEQAQAADLAHRFADRVRGLEIESRARQFCCEKARCCKSMRNGAKQTRSE